MINNKMKTSTIILAAILLLSSTGCSSDKKYEDLEKRVALLESKLGVSSSDPDEESKTTADPTESTDVSDDPSESTDSPDDLPFYYIDNLTEQEIVDRCKYLFYNPPYQGETFEEYYSIFETPPMYTDVSRDFTGVYCQWIDKIGYYRGIDVLNPDYTIDNISRNAILTVEINGTQTEMDGTIGYIGDYHGLFMELYILDYETAAAIYDDLLQWISEITTYTELTDTREASSWLLWGSNPAESNDYDLLLSMKTTYVTYTGDGPTKVDGYVIMISILSNTTV